MQRPSDMAMKKILTDYRLEEMLWPKQSWNRIQKEGKSKPEEMAWRHRVQYAVSHAVNEYYSLLPELRREVPIQYLLEKRWPKRVTGFDSTDHYWQVKTLVNDELIRLLSQRAELEYPVLLFEELNVYISELKMRLSVIFQTAWQLDKEHPSRLSVQKYMVSYHPEVVYAYQQMMTVFCVQAFGQLPHSIEVDCLIEGKKVTCIPDEQDYLLALDYVKLAYPLCDPTERKVDSFEYLLS